MTRELKFRGIVFEGNEYVYGWGCYTDEFGKCYVISKKTICIRVIKIEQSTGLKDRNGKEIYEGDIILMLYTDWPSQSSKEDGKYEFTVEEYMKNISKKGVVIFKEDRWCLEFDGKYGKFTDRIFEGPHGRKEVIGYVHQNPELLPA